VGALKNIMRMLLKCLMIVIILSAVGAFLAYIISQKTGREFYKVLEIIGIIIMLPGALSVLGNREIMASYKYNITKFTNNTGINACCSNDLHICGEFQLQEGLCHCDNDSNHTVFHTDNTGIAEGYSII